MASANPSSLHAEIDKRVAFITRYEALGESHMVDFLISDHWNRFVHPDAQERLLQLEDTDLYSLSDATAKLDFSQSSGIDVKTGQHLIEDLEHYLKAACDCGISSSGLCRTVAEVSTKLTDRKGEDKSLQIPMCDVNTKEYMCSKKSHEVEKMSEFVNLVCKAFDVKDILDFGSGKGYLGAYLALRYGYAVTGIDCSETNSLNASKRAEKYLKYWNAYLKNKSENTQNKPLTENLKYRPLTAHVDGRFDVNSLLTTEAEPVARRTTLTGLHACGDLSSTCLRTFISTPTIKAVCAVGCCYHQLTALQDVQGNCTGFPMSTYLKKSGFSLGRNSRMLGLRALEKTQNTQSVVIEEKSTRSLFYRAVLSVILQEEFRIDCRDNKQIQIGKTYSKSKDFPDYVRKCLKKLDLREKGPSELSDEKICRYMQSYQSRKKSLMAFNILREAFAPAVEALILLDRLLYLEEQRSEPMTVHLVRLFDPVLSPRCYAIVATRDA